jgi:hypothetical protein
MCPRRRRAPWWRDETGSLPVAMLLILVSTSVSALLAPIVLVQLGSTRLETSRQRTVSGAQAGLDVALGQVRRANDGAGNGVPASLPCGPLSGSVGGDGASAYRVTIEYYQVSTPSPVLITCPTAKTGVPLDHAVLTSTGSAAGSGTRKLTATYKFWWTNTNLAGGTIPTFPVAGSPLLCMDAGSSTPPDPTPLRMQLCDPTNPAQIWVYNTDLSLMLVSSLTAVTGPMCLEAGPIPHTVGAQVVIRQCITSGARYQQMWSLNNHANFEGTADGQTTDKFCFNVAQPGVPNSIVILGTNSKSTCQQEHDNVESWQPDASAGAGAAGPATAQLVNYGQFGRCLDVPLSDVNHAFMIVWPCKQTPDPTAIAANEKWVNVPSPISPAGSGKVLVTTTKKGAGRYCLVPPTSPDIYVVLTNCGNDAMVKGYMEWTVHDGSGPVYQTYWYVDSNNRCMSPDDASNSAGPDGPGAGISRVIEAPCNSASGLLKWNAQPGVIRALPLTGFGEK